MEIVIATTSASHAQQMQQTLVGHTMSGEALEQRPQVQYTSAEDFLGAALQIYEITAIRCQPSAKNPALLDVIAEYRPAIFHCEACGQEHSDYPDQLFGLDGYAHHFVCSPACRRVVQERLSAEMAAYRAALGDPIAAGVAHMWNEMSWSRRAQTRGRIDRVLSDEENRTIGGIVRRMARQGLLDALSHRIACRERQEEFL